MAGSIEWYVATGKSRAKGKGQRAKSWWASPSSVLVLSSLFLALVLDIPGNGGHVGYGALATGAGGLFRRRTG